MRIFFVVLSFFVLSACGSDPEPTASDTAAATDATDTDADVAPDADGDVAPDAPSDTPVLVDVGDDDVLPDAIEPEDAGEPHSCGGLTCAAAEVCIVRCLCCGIDTGNPDDQQTDYECVAPTVDCDGSPSECARDMSGNGGCYPSNDLLLECPCA